jgi:hypothetical protein
MELSLNVNILYEKVMLYSCYALISVVIFALVHLFGSKLRMLPRDIQAKFLSAVGGVAIAYVFIDLLPKLATSETLVKEALSGIFPYFERHVYIMALVGFLLFFLVDRSHEKLKKKKALTLSIVSYSLFNFMVGYAVVDPHDPEVQPLALFTFAIGLHYFANDFSFDEMHGKEYDHKVKWILIAALFLGWTTGLFIDISKTAIALLGAFIGGGVIMNVTRHELPKKNPNSTGAFLFGAAFYTLLLLTI